MKMLRQTEKERERKGGTEEERDTEMRGRRGRAATIVMRLACVSVTLNTKSKC